jgi:NAD+ kinase
VAVAVGSQNVSLPATVRDDRRRVAVLYHPRVDASQPLARELVAELVGRGAEATLLNAWEEKGGLSSRLGQLDWLVAMGGDGTLIRVGRLAAEYGLPLIGVNFGRLGFLAEVSPHEALAQIPALLDGSGTVEERLMLRCHATVRGELIGPFDAVNDVFVGRGRVARAVRLSAAVDEVPVIRFAADGVILATPTGSTAYSLSAGGPVVSPQLDVFLFTPVVPHPVPVRAIVLQRSARVELTVHTDEDAVLSVDGQLHHPLHDGDTVRIEAAPHALRLLRAGGRDQFFKTLVERLRRW